MRMRFRHFWERLRAGYWFVPTLMVIAGGALALVMLRVDRELPGPGEHAWWLYSGGAEGARTLLSTVATSIITVAGVVFSITMLIIVQASAQFGPRLLRTFVRDGFNQVALGMFVATFVYCLLVVRRVYDVNDDKFVPAFSITVAIVLAAGSVFVLVGFIHHVSQIIQAPVVISNVEREMHDAIGQMFPGELGCSGGPPDNSVIHALQHEARPLTLRKNGYIQTINCEKLLSLADDNDLILHLKRRPGDFITADEPAIAILPPEKVHGKLIEEICDSYLIGRRRTPEQDVEFAIRQLVEIAVRALSPSMNDPFTAVNCVDWLGAALARLAGHKFPTPWRYNDEGRFRAWADMSDFAGIMDVAFNQIRQHGRRSVAVMIRIVEALQNVARCVQTDEQRAVLLRHAQMLRDAARESFPQKEDFNDFTQRYERLVALLEKSSQK